MKKKWMRFVALIVALVLTGCGTQTLESTESVSTESTTESDSATAEADSNLGNYLDLSVFSDTVLYSELTNILVQPADYLGMTIRMTGTFQVYYDTAVNSYYYACVVYDATQCCTSGLEFTLADDTLEYPDDYPEDGDTITVEGVLSQYKEGQYQYLTLADATLIEE